MGRSLGAVGPSPPMCQYPALVEWVRVYASGEQHPLRILLLQLQNKRVPLMLLPRGGCTNVGPCSVLGVLGPPSSPQGWGGCKPDFCQSGHPVQSRIGSKDKRPRMIPVTGGHSAVMGSSTWPGPEGHPMLSVLRLLHQKKRRYTGVCWVQRPWQPQGFTRVPSCVAGARNPRLLPWECQGWISASQL